MMHCLHFCRGRCILRDAALVFCKGGGVCTMHCLCFAMGVHLRAAVRAFVQGECICMMQCLHFCRGRCILYDAVLLFCKRGVFA